MSKHVMLIAEPKYVLVELTEEQTRVLETLDTFTAFEKLSEMGLKNFVIVEEKEEYGYEQKSTQARH